MHIAQIAPLFESVPPASYGGTERVVSYLTEELVRQGHQVTLFASGDSKTDAALVPGSTRSLRLDSSRMDQLVDHVVMLEKVARMADSFDLIHAHLGYLHYPFARRWKTPTLTTQHGRLDMADLIPLYKEYKDMPLISISNAQRRPLPWANWQGTVYHGLPVDSYRLMESQDSYIAFLGRISPEKRLDRAIRVAEKAGVPLKVAAKIDPQEKDYYSTQIKPLFKASPHVEYIGEIGEDRKNAFLGKALGMLFLIDWPEPFGLVMIEAMACGTPVIAQRQGSVPEIIEEGITGFIVETEDEAVRAIQKIGQLDRRLIRQRFEERFSAQRMALDYLRMYQNAIHRESPVAMA